MQNFISLTLNKDFLRLYYRGKSAAKPGVVVYGSRNRENVCRIGITTGKKIGNAVERNRSRRVIKAAWQNICAQGLVNGTWDFVFVARGKTKFLKSTQIEVQMKEALTAIGAIK